MRRFLEWLSTPEGPDLIDSHSDPPTVPYMALAVGLDPDHLYRNPKGVVAGIGLVYKPCYISTMPFADAYDIIGDYLEGSTKSLARPCLLFLSISDRSAVFPYIGDNPPYVDLASKEKSETHPTGGRLGDFRSFLLPRVMAKPNKNSNEYSCCTGYPRHPGGRPTLINPLAPRRKNDAFLREVLCFPMILASQDHWTFCEDTEFQAWVSQLEKERDEASKPEEQKGPSEVPSKGFIAGARGSSKDEEMDEPTPGGALDDMMEVDGDGASHGRTKPLRTLMSQAGLSTSNRSQSAGNLDYEEIVLNGDEDTEEASLPPAVARTIKVLLERLHALHLQALFEMGSVRVVDRVSAEQLMANFAHVNLVMGEDLNQSLRSLVDTTKGACSGLLADIRTALGPTMFSMAEVNISQAVEKYHQRVDFSLTQTLAYLDCARRDARTFLRERASSLKSNEELEEMVAALSERLSNHSRQVWDVVLSSEMNDPRVGMRVNAALSAIRPMVANYFGGVLEGLMGSLSLSPPNGEGLARSTQEGVERRVAVALQRRSSQDGVKLQGLHVDYSHDFATRDVGIPIPALSSTALPNLLETMDRLRSNLPPVPAQPRAILKEEALFKKLLQVQAANKGENTEVYRLSQVLTQLSEEFKKELVKETEEKKSTETPPTPPRDNTPPPEGQLPVAPPSLHPLIKLRRTVTGVTKPSKLPNPASKNKVGESTPPESEDPMTNALAMEVDDSTDSGITIDANTSKEEAGANDSKTRKRKSTDSLQPSSTLKKPKPGQFLEGVTVKHGPNASVTFVCKVSANKDGSLRTQSLSDEEGEASGGEGDLPEKVTSTPFHSDEDFTSPEAKRRPSIPPPKPTPKKTEQKPRKPEEEKDKEDGEEATDGSDDSDSGSEMELPGKEEAMKIGPSDHPALVKARLQKRIEVYIDDRTVARIVRGSIMGLESGKEPSRIQVEADKNFKLRGPKDGPKSITNISKHWVSRLADLHVLGEAPLNEFEPIEGWPQIYTWENFVKHVNDIATGGLWSRRAKPSLVVIVPASSPELTSSYFLTLLHKEKSITRKSVYYRKEEPDGKKFRVQYSFCAYCGVLSMNKKSGYSHLRKHLGVEFICGGCLGYKDSDPLHISAHMETCVSCVEARGGTQRASAPPRKSRKGRGKAK